MPAVQGRFYPTLESFRLASRVGLDSLAILDPQTFDRWVSQEHRFKSQPRESNQKETA
jgi:hypothetical protein